MWETPPVCQLTKLKSNTLDYLLRDKQVTRERESEKMPNKRDYGGGTEVDKQQIKEGESVCMWVCVNSSGNSGGGYKGGVGMANC